MDESSEKQNKKNRRECSISIIKQKFRKKHIDVCMVPYLGKKYSKHSQKNNKSFNGIRNILVVDLWLSSKYSSVEEQILDTENPYSLKSLLPSFEGELDIDDLVYHCFFSHSMHQQLDTVEKYRLKSWGYDKKKHFVTKIDLGITSNDIELSAEIFKDVIKWCRPDIILFLGAPLWFLITDYREKSGFTFDKMFKDSNVSCNVVDYLQFMCDAGLRVEGDESLRLFGENTIDFLRYEKKHRYLNTLYFTINSIQKHLNNLRQEVGHSKYFEYIDGNMDMLKKKIDLLVEADKNYYKPYKDTRNRDNKK